MKRSHIPQSFSSPLCCGPFALSKGDNGISICAPLYPSAEWKNTEEGTSEMKKAESALNKAIEQQKLPEGTQLRYTADPQIASVIVPYNSWAAAEAEKHRIKDTILTVTGASVQNGLAIPKFNDK